VAVITYSTSIESVIKYWKITLMGMPEKIRVNFGADDIRRPISHISAIILVIQSISSLLEP